MSLKVTLSFYSFLSCISVFHSCTNALLHLNILRSCSYLYCPPVFLLSLIFKCWSFWPSLFFDLSCASIYLPLILFYAIYLVSLVYNEVACMSTVDLLLFSEGKMSHRRTRRELQRKRDVVNICHSICCLHSFLSSCCQPLISLCPASIIVSLHLSILIPLSRQWTALSNEEEPFCYAA